MNKLLFSIAVIFGVLMTSTAFAHDVRGSNVYDASSYANGYNGSRSCGNGGCNTGCNTGCDTSCDTGCPSDQPCGDCWCLYCRYQPCYYNQWRCECEPRSVQRRCCRWVPREYEVQRCRYVPQYYCEKCCRYEPEYYCVDQCVQCKKWVCDRQCTYRPCYYYKRVCNSACNATAYCAQ